MFASIKKLPIPLRIFLLPAILALVIMARGGDEDTPLRIGMLKSLTTAARINDRMPKFVVEVLPPDQRTKENSGYRVLTGNQGN